MKTSKEFIKSISQGFGWITDTALENMLRTEGVEPLRDEIIAELVKMNFLFSENDLIVTDIIGDTDPAERLISKYSTKLL